MRTLENDLWAKRPDDRRAVPIVFAFIAIFVLYFALDCRRILQGHFGDFRHFYYAADALLHHRDLYTSGTGGYIYPPLIAFLYTPVALLPYRTAAFVMLGVNCILAATAIRLAAVEFVDRFALSKIQLLIASVALLGAVLDIDKIRNELQMLQTNALMLLMFVLALRWLDRRPTLAGICLGVVFNMKYLSLAMLPYLIVRRRWGATVAFVLGAVGLALLPATIAGWQANLANLKTGLGGLLHMVGVGGGEQANVEDIKALFSSSITSSMARLTDAGFTMHEAMLYVALTALATVLVVIVIYQRERLPLFAWPAAREQRMQPFRAMVGLEWAGLVTAALVFSPQTNTRHLFLAMLVTIPAAALLLAAPLGKTRWVLALATAIMFLGFVLPPGKSEAALQSANIRWTSVGGACWCLLMVFLTVLSVGMKYVGEYLATNSRKHEEAMEPQMHADSHQ